MVYPIETSKITVLLLQFLNSHKTNKIKMEGKGFTRNSEKKEKKKISLLHFTLSSLGHHVSNSHTRYFDRKDRKSKWSTHWSPFRELERHGVKVLNISSVLILLWVKYPYNTSNYLNYIHSRIVHSFILITSWLVNRCK